MYKSEQISNFEPVDTSGQGGFDDSARNRLEEKTRSSQEREDSTVQQISEEFRDLRLALETKMIDQIGECPAQMELEECESWSQFE